MIISLLLIIPSTLWIQPGNTFLMKSAIKGNSTAVHNVLKSGFNINNYRDLVSHRMIVMLGLHISNDSRQSSSLKIINNLSAITMCSLWPKFFTLKHFSSPTLLLSLFTINFLRLICNILNALEMMKIGWRVYSF